MSETDRLSVKVRCVVTSTERGASYSTLTRSISRNANAVISRINSASSGNDLLRFVWITMLIYWRFSSYSFVGIIKINTQNDNNISMYSDVISYYVVTSIWWRHVRWTCSGTRRPIRVQPALTEAGDDPEVIANDGDDVPLGAMMWNRFEKLPRFSKSWSIRRLPLSFSNKWCMCYSISTRC